MGTFPYDLGSSYSYFFGFLIFGILVFRNFGYLEFRLIRDLGVQDLGFIVFNRDPHLIDKVKLLEPTLDLTYSRFITNINKRNPLIKYRIYRKVLQN